MTISSETRTAGPFTGTGLVDTYPFEFKVFTAADVLVVETDTDGVESTLELTADYTVTLNADQDDDPGGSITLVAGSLTDDHLLTLTSQLEYLQETELTNAGGFFPRVINDALDKLTILIQQVSTLVNRSLKFPLSDGTAVVTELPTATVRATKVLAFDADGDVTVSDLTLAEIEASSSAANEAEAAQVAAEAAQVAAEAAQVAVEAIADAYTDARPVDRFNGTGAQTAFTLTSAPGSENNTWVFISGVYQQKDTYSLSGTTLTFSVAPPAGTSNIEVVYGTLLPIGTPSDGTVTGAKLGSMTSAQLAAALTDETGTGSVVLATRPTLASTVGVGGATAAASGAGISFPAAQSASTDGNTLDDYEEGTWTPAISFQTPGNLSVAYTTQVGTYVKVGKQVTVSCHVLASSFTHTTASLSLVITGLPFTSENVSGARWAGALIFQGVTIATYTNFAAVLSNNSSSVLVAASATATGYTFLQSSHVPAGGTPSFIFTLTYNAA